MFSNRLVSGLPQCGYHDLDVEIIFIPQFPKTEARAGKPGARNSQGTPLPPAIGLKGEIAEDGRWVVIEEGSDPLPDRAWCVRRVLPFMAALQEKVTLHASAVAHTTGVHAFIGASGAGKSTLSRRLAGLALRMVADDLLPCRMLRGSVVIPLDQTLLPLRAIYFLTRDDSVVCVDYTRLTSSNCLKRLLVHGFGEVSLRKAWAVQFAFYGSIARTVPACALVVPDNLSRLPNSALQVKELMVEQRLPIASSQAAT